MNEIANIHRNETIDYVLNLVRGLHRTEADRAAFYATQPHAISLENIARDRSGCLLQLVNAIEAGLFDQLDTDAATEAFVDVADAERYALRDEYVNSADPERTTLAEQLRAVGAEQAAQDAEADAFHAQRRADEAEANGEHVDYDEAEDVREIEREMAIEAGDDSEIDRQVAEDDARFERAIWLANRDAESEA